MELISERSTALISTAKDQQVATSLTTEFLERLEFRC
jgi:hypothetical protein